MRKTLAVLLALAFATTAFADTSYKQEFSNRSHDIENTTKNATGKTASNVKRGSKKAKERAGQTGKNVHRKTKKSAQDVSRDIKNG